MVLISVGSRPKTCINIDSASLETPSTKDLSSFDKKRLKKNKSNDLDEQLLEVVKTLQNSEGPCVEECNCILDEMQLFEMTDPLYTVACSIFCEGKAYREQWVLHSQKPEIVRKNWIELNGKKLGLL